MQGEKDDLLRAVLQSGSAHHNIDAHYRQIDSKSRDSDDRENLRRVEDYVEGFL